MFLNQKNILNRYYYYNFEQFLIQESCGVYDFENYRERDK